MSMSIAGKKATRKDKSGHVFGPCIIGAAVSTHMLGKPTSYLQAHELWHQFTDEQVTFIQPIVCM
jgi:hypothetical protein